MKKLSRLLLGLVLMSCIVLILCGRKVSAASDKLLDTFFPNGIEKVELKKHVINNGAWFDEYPSELDVYIRQSDDFLKLESEYQKLEFEFNLDDYHNDFEMKYGIAELGIGVQFDISVDGGDWLYNKKWDKMDCDSTKGIPAGFPVKFGFGGDYASNILFCQLMLAYEIDNDPGVMKGAYIKPGDKYEDGKIDLDNHTINTRYRYYLEYVVMDTEERVAVFSDWSKEVSVGKNGNQKRFEVPDKIPVPTLENPTRDLDNEGNWNAIHVWTVFDEDVTDAALAIEINDGVASPFYLVPEAAVNDLAEKSFKEYELANDNWLINANRLLGSFEGSNDDRILLRGYLKCYELNKKSAYAYAVPQVKGLKVKKAKTTSLTLTWNKVADAEFYEIYDKDNKLVATSKTNSVTIKKLKAATGYDYKVRAVVDKVFVGLFSDTLQCATQPKKTKISKASLSGGNFSVTYKKQAGTGYQIQVATDKKFKNTVADVTVPDIKTVKAAQDVPGAEALKGSAIYVRVRVYFTYGDVTTYSTWSKVKTVK